MDPGFPVKSGAKPRGGGAPTYNFVKIEKKWHVIKKIWGWGKSPRKSLTSGFSGLLVAVWVLRQHAREQLGVEVQTLGAGCLNWCAFGAVIVHRAMIRVGNQNQWVARTVRTRTHVLWKLLVWNSLIKKLEVATSCGHLYYKAMVLHHCQCYNFSSMLTLWRTAKDRFNWRLPTYLHIQAKKIVTRLHSSGMRTACLLTVSRSTYGGMSAWGCLSREVSARGGGRHPHPPVDR